jgi:hypothetical protein
MTGIGSVVAPKSVIARPAIVTYFTQEFSRDQSATHRYTLSAPNSLTNCLECPLQSITGSTVLPVGDHPSQFGIQTYK